MKKLIFVLTISAFFISGCSSGGGSYRSSYDFGDIEKIAIVAVEGQVSNKAAQIQIADLFAYELLNKGYAPIMLEQVRTRIEAIEAMAELSQSTYVDMGVILKVPAVLVVNVPYFEEEIFITAHLIDVKDGSVLWMEKDSGKIPQKTAEAFPYGRNEEDYLTDPFLIFQEPPQAQRPLEPPVKAGERALRPLELEKIEDIVSNICGSLPKVATKQEITTRTRTKPRTTTTDW